MEPWQKEHIKKNLVELLKYTSCNSQLLAGLISKDILSESDAEQIELGHLIPSDKCKKLYEILQTRVGSYDCLVQCLKESSQSGALRILNEHSTEFRSFVTITFDKHHILGTGRSGTVYKGTFDGRDVAVKVINTYAISSENAMREINFLKQLDDHPNIVRCFFAESRDNCIYIALEYCNTNLQDEIKLNLLKIDPIIILKKSTKGLLHLHKHNVIHRDIKPANILLKYNNQVKLSDFGISNQIPEGMTSTTFNSGVSGTAEWLAPEILQQLDDDEIKREPLRMKKSADIFSLGCVYFFVLTNGAHPFGRKYERQMNILLDKHQLQGSKVEMRWKDLIKKMISHQASKRPPCEDILTGNYFEIDISRNLHSFHTSGFVSEESSLQTTLKYTPKSSLDHKIALDSLKESDSEESIYSDSSDETPVCPTRKIITPVTAIAAEGPKRAGPGTVNVVGIRVHIKALDGKIYKIIGLTNWTVKRLKEEFNEWRGEVDAQCILSYRTQRLVDDDVLDTVIQSNFRSTRQGELRNADGRLNRAATSSFATKYVGAKLPVKIRTMEGKSFMIEARTDWTVQRLKEECEERLGEVYEKRLLHYRGRQLVDNEVLSTYRIEPDSVILACFSHDGWYMDVVQIM